MPRRDTTLNKEIPSKYCILIINKIVNQADSVNSGKHFNKNNFPSRTLAAKKRPPSRMSFARRGVEKAIISISNTPAPHPTAKSRLGTRAVTLTQESLCSSLETFRRTSPRI